MPNAPLPTHRRRMKWNRLTSPSKSIGYIRRLRLGVAGDDMGRAYLRSTADSAHGCCEPIRGERAEKRTRRLKEGEEGGAEVDCREGGRAAQTGEKKEQG